MTASPAALLALAAEVEAGEGPDRELDARVWVALYGGEVVALQPGYVQSGDWSAIGFTQSYMDSVDAALFLLAALLPGWCYDMDDLGDEPCVRLSGPGSGEGQSQRGEAPTLTRAIVAAVLRAVAGRG